MNQILKDTGVDVFQRRYIFMDDLLGQLLF